MLSQSIVDVTYMNQLKPKTKSKYFINASYHNTKVKVTLTLRNDCGPGPRSDFCVPLQQWHILNIGSVF